MDIVAREHTIPGLVEAMEGYFQRGEKEGNGVYWFSDDGFYFLRYLTRGPICIPFSDVVGTELGTKHAGRWAMGNLIVKIIWRKGELTLSSGFLVSKKGEDAMILKAELEKRIHEKGRV